MDALGFSNMCLSNVSQMGPIEDDFPGSLVNAEDVSTFPALHRFAPYTSDISLSEDIGKPTFLLIFVHYS